MTKVLLRLVLLFMLLLFVGASYIAWSSYQLLHQPLSTAATTDNDQQAPQLIEIKSGSHLRAVLKQLHDIDLLEDPLLAYYSARLWQQPTRIQAGVYALVDKMSLVEILRKLEQGDAHLFSVTLVEGFTLQQWRTLLASHPYLAHDTSLLTEAQLYQKIAPGQPWPSLEGALFPDTYHFKAYTSELSILQSAFQKMQDEVHSIWAERDRGIPLSSAYELLIMASIIEKETGQDGERDLVSSVFTNRLHKGMRLQSDPTTIYGVKDFDGDLTRAHLREHTPYNTYRIDGLPPTPIAMPSRASLKAAAAPAESDYYYFVANNKGEHIFSRTLAEHNRAVNKYQRNQGN